MNDLDSLYPTGTHLNFRKAKNIHEVFANKISEYVQDHLDQEIRIDDLATMVGVSKFHLNRLFQATTGFQLGEFVQRRRLQKAYALLAQGNTSVIDVSLAVGYESNSSFSRAFLKAFRCKPSDVKIGSASVWQTPLSIKNPGNRDSILQPDIVALPSQTLLGLYGAGFSNNSFISVALALFDELDARLERASIPAAHLPRIGVALESPWYGDQRGCQYFAGLEEVSLSIPEGENWRAHEFKAYPWAAGTWARFEYRGSYSLMWQTISRIYAGWVIPEGIALKDTAIVQVYLNNSGNTAEADLQTALYFPMQD